MMKAVRFHGQRDIRLDDVEIVQCGEGQVKVGAFLIFEYAKILVLSVVCQVKPAFAGICGSGIAAAPLPRSMMRLTASFQTCMNILEGQV